MPCFHTTIFIRQRAYPFIPSNPFFIFASILHCVCSQVKLDNEATEPEGMLKSRYAAGWLNDVVLSLPNKWKKLICGHSGNP